MGRAYECDRCKCLYTNHSGRRSSDVYITTTPNDTTGLRDLCPACHEKLRSWWAMENKPDSYNCYTCKYNYIEPPYEEEPCETCLSQQTFNNMYPKYERKDK